MARGAFTAPRVGAAGLLAVLALGWAFLFLGSRPLADPDEGRYAETAREMLVHRSWLVPLLAGRPHLTKPPPTYWLSAAGQAVLGHNEWGARWGTGLAFALSILAAGGIGSVFAGGERRAGVFSALAWGTSLLPFVGGSLVTTDPVLAAAEAGAVLAGARALLVPGRTRKRDLRLAWAALGLGFFVKGPPGLLPLVGLAWAWPRRRDPDPSERFLDPVGLLLFAGIACWWYAAVGLEDPSRLRRFLVVEVYERVFSDRLRRNGPPWLPLAVLLAGALPWGPLLFLPRPGAAGRLTRPLEDPRVRLLGGWLGASLLVFTASRSRMPLYVLPVSLALLVPAGLRVSGWWHRAGRGRRALFTVLLLAWMGCLGGVRVIAGRWPRYRTARPVARAVERVRRPGEPVLLLGSRPWPGLMFYLGEEVPVLAVTDRALRRPHDLELPDLRARLRAGRGSALVVACGEGDDRLSAAGRVVAAGKVARPPCRILRVFPGEGRTYLLPGRSRPAPGDPAPGTRTRRARCPARPAPPRSPRGRPARGSLDGPRDRGDPGALPRGAVAGQGRRRGDRDPARGGRAGARPGRGAGGPVERLPAGPAGPGPRPGPGR